MANREAQAFHALDSACYEMIHSKLILNSARISGVLSAVASNELLKNLVADCMTGFDYDKEFRNCLYKFGTKVHFKMPALPKKAVALIVNLLYDFDNGTINFVEFITTVFPEARAEDSYKRFSENVVEPFLEHVKNLLFADKEIVIGETDRMDSETILVNSALNDKSDYLLKDFKRLAERYASETDRDTVLFMMDGLRYTLELRDIKLIKIAFTGLKSVVKEYRQFSGILNELEGVIRMYMVK
ncbi:MAG: hypothetical protein LBT20_01240 [Clostridiales bacterium]|jgi:hypothetical protein|nr:hypothetical protein [Clostridiales bacterium]